MAIVAAPVAKAGAATPPRDSAAGVPVIWDTDLYSSFDDGGAELTLLAMQLMGIDHVIAIGVDTRIHRPKVATASWKCAAAIAQYYGFPNIPIGSDMPDNGPTPTTDNFIGPCAADAAPGTPSPQPVVDVYRRALVAEPDDSVVVVGTGYEENLAALLNSPPDAISPLSGSQLISEKVKELVLTGGGYPSNTGENNFVGNAQAARAVVANWPTKIVYSGYEVGHAVLSGGNVVRTLPANDPIRAAMLDYAGTRKSIASYDLTTAYHAVQPGDASLTEVGPGTNAIGRFGANTYTAGTGNDYYLQLNNATSLEGALNHLWVTLPGTTSQGLAFTSTAPSNPTLGTSYQASTNTGSSGNPVTLTIDPASTSGCTIDGNGLVSFAVPSGTCVVDAQEPGTTTYAPALVKQTLHVVRIPQTVTFTSTAPSSPVVGSTYSPTATGGASGNPVTFSIDATSTSGCTVSGGTVTFSAPFGTCVIDASQAGNTTYADATTVSQVVGVGGDPQTVSFTTTPPGAHVGGADYTPLATASSGLPVTITLDQSSTGCTLSSGVVSFKAVGTCVIDANQAGNTTFVPAMGTQPVSIGKGATVITITSSAPAHPTAGKTYTPTATSSSGDAVVIGLGTRSRGCALARGTVTFRSVGSCVVTFTDPGNADWSSAVATHQVLSIGRGHVRVIATAAPTAIRAGGVVALRATVSVAFASGTVTFTSGSLTLCTTTLRHGTATCHAATSQLGKGAHAIVAAYSGSAAFFAARGRVTVRIT